MTARLFKYLNNFLWEFTLIKKDGLIYVVPASTPNIIKTALQQLEEIK